MFCDLDATDLLARTRTLGGLSSFKRCCAKGVYRPMSCWGIIRQSAVLYRLLTQIIEAPRGTQENKRLSERQTHKKKKWIRTIVSKIEFSFLALYL